MHKNQLTPVKYTTAHLHVVELQLISAPIYIIYRLVLQDLMKR